MSPLAIAACAFGALVVAMAVKATVAIMRDVAMQRGRKAAQIAFSWCVPIIGPMIVLHLLREEELPPPKKSKWDPETRELDHAGRDSLRRRREEDSFGRETHGHESSESGGD